MSGVILKNKSVDFSKQLTSYLSSYLGSDIKQLKLIKLSFYLGNYLGNL